MEAKLLKAQVTQVSDDQFVAYASVEMMDEEGDIIRIDGIDLSYHSAESPIKLFPEHEYSLVDGRPAVIGRVESLEKTVHPTLNVPALKFVGSWAKDANGQKTDLSKAWKELYDTGYLDSFSVGVDRVDGKKIKDGGVDWEKTKLIEISCAAIPANKYANVIKVLKKHGVKTMADITPDATKDLSQAKPSGVQDGATTGHNVGAKDMGSDMQMCMDHITKTHKDMGDMMQMHITKCVGDMCKAMDARFDDIESAITVAQDGPDRVSVSQKALKEIEMKKHIDLKKQEEELAKLFEALNELKKSFGK